MTPICALGERYQDNVTGFVGYAVARTEYVTGQSRVTLEELGKDGDIKTAYFDEERVSPVPKAAQVEADAMPGGPDDDKTVAAEVAEATR